MSETRKNEAILIGYSRLAALLLALLSLAARAGAAEYYGYDQGGSRFAPLDQIAPGNVDQLIPAWTYHTGDLKSRAADVLKRSKFEVTPIVTGDKLIACTPFNAVVALDPGTGQELWRYDPEIKTDYRPGNMFNCRGVAVWRGPSGANRDRCAWWASRPRPRTRRTRVIPRPRRCWKSRWRTRAKNSSARRS